MHGAKISLNLQSHMLAVSFAARRSEHAHLESLNITAADLDLNTRNPLPAASRRGHQWRRAYADPLRACCIGSWENHRRKAHAFPAAHHAHCRCAETPTL